MPEFQVHLSSLMIKAKRKTRLGARIVVFKRQHQVVTALSTEHLLWARHSNRPWRYNDGWDDLSPSHTGPTLDEL